MHVQAGKIEAVPRPVVAPGAAPVVEFRGVSFSYNGGPDVLRDVNFSIAAGDYVAVLGPNGGGKSTLLKLMLGVLRPRSGEIRVLGQAPGGAARRIGYMPQSTGRRRELPMTVLDVVLTGLMGQTRRWPRFRDDERALALAALERTGVADLRGRRIGDLSGGQRQRVYIARALVAAPEILVLDEPTASVDAQGRCSLLELLAELNSEMSILYVSHDLSIVASGVRSVACVNRTLHFHGRPEVTRDMLSMMYGDGGHTCPVEIFTHGDVPHRVVPRHAGPDCAGCPGCQGDPGAGAGGGER